MSRKAKVTSIMVPELFRESLSKWLLRKDDVELLKKFDKVVSDSPKSFPLEAFLLDAAEITAQSPYEYKNLSS
ncbi:1389_t:CDS:2 [Funneliformis geosporum]|uniref:1389_t:CDS:1 n=1 Tax=Funneliformis geosporum TaxID=1117311 RepID=A0A9W4SR90_9GLOM|nr:1389_t:CDS:2 [Funneliformis geosporum]